MGTFTLALKEVIAVRPDIGLSTYPIFDEEYRAGLNQKIIDHYWNQEIGQETIEMFTFALRRKMNEIMPKYNAIYKAQALQINPMINFSTKSSTASDQTGKALTEDSQSTTSNVGETGTSKTTTGSTSKSRTVSSEFPQQSLADNGDYASSATDAVSDGSADNATTSDATTRGTSAGTGQSANTSEMSASVQQSSEGFTGVSFAAMVAEYSDLFVNTDMEIISELQTLFMLIWDNGAAFTQGFNNTMGGWY